MTNYEMLQNRAIIEIEGEDRKKFLQGLVTNDVNKVSGKNLLYTAMLNAQGRFLYDFFIFEEGEKLVVDCDKSRRDEIVQKLSLYKLRSKVTLKKNDELQVFCAESGEGFIDPRHAKLGVRLYKKAESEFNSKNDSDYLMRRISLKIAEGESDLTHEKSFILEFDFDNLNAIDYQKGCYVGQELTARTHYRGEIRKKLFHVVINGATVPAKNSEITCEGKSAGIILSSVSSENKIHALALIKDSPEIDLQNLVFESQKIIVIA